MKRFSLITIISTLSMGLFAHPGHTHQDMSESTLLGHLAWIIIPAAIFAVIFFTLRKRKSAKQ